MKYINIDIESFSSVDLSKCGVYRYASSPDFDILLFGYSVDGGDVHVVDLACGEEIPADIVAALSDDSVIKWSYNNNFERGKLALHDGVGGLPWPSAVIGGCRRGAWAGEAEAV